MAMILELGSNMEWIRVTAEYSNAVLAAVLPYFSEFSQKLDLPVPYPITVQDVKGCGIAPFRHATMGIDVGVQLKNGWHFGFGSGRVSSFTGPHEYYGLQDPGEIPKYFGEVRMTKAEAVQMARDTIKKMGISLEQVFAEQDPWIQGPPIVGTNTVPRYLIGWRNPRTWPRPEGQPEVPWLRFEINAELKRVESFMMMGNKNLERPPPKIAVEPPCDLRYPRHEVNPEYARRLIPIVLRAIDDYGQTLSLPVPRPLTTN